jgi:hypothetical protein
VKGNSGDIFTTEVKGRKISLAVPKGENYGRIFEKINWKKD